MFQATGRSAVLESSVKMSVLTWMLFWISEHKVMGWICGDSNSQDNLYAQHLFSAHVQTWALIYRLCLIF